MADDDVKKAKARAPKKRRKKKKSSKIVRKKRGVRIKPHKGPVQMEMPLQMPLFSRLSPS
jgi:2-succinyl-5-enolpyruvyl-6-hydroxy-3-cyclohexene-1-carboxylate synthase